MDYVAIGKIIKPHGYKGAIKIKSETRDDIDYNVIAGVFIDGIFFNIEEVFLAGGEVVLKLEGINDIDAVNKLRGKLIQIEKEEYFKSKNEDDVLVSELEDADIVLSTGEEIGTLVSVENFGASDLFFIKSHKYTNLIVPNIDGLVISYEKNEKKLVFDKKIFFEVKTHD